MELNLEKKQQLEKLLVKPSLATQEHIPFLQQLIKTFPYYQPLYLLLAKASSKTEGRDKAFTKAALYTNGSILHRLIHEQNLDVVEDINVISYEPWANNVSAKLTTNEQIVSATETSSNATAESLEVPTIENIAPLANEVISVEEPEEQATVNQEIPTAVSQANQDFVLPEIENLEPLQSEIISAEEPEDQATVNKQTLTAVPQANQDFVLPEIENLEPLQSEIIKVCEPEQQINEAPEADEQEVFEEINEFIAPPEIILKEQEVTIENAEVEAPALIETEKEEAEIPSPNLIEEKLILETVAATDFFAFDRSFGTEVIEETTTETVIDEVAAEPTASAEPFPENIVSKYDDDQLPFTFLWWLAKTRKDHEQIFRPFASPVTANAQPLQQQYVEHIFHIQAPLEPIEEEQETSLVPATKENEIIDNFIKNDPQIKALKPDQINNENKAKRSAEDSNDVVSETLAQIYIEQMLYHKAIDTYQKLSLKFPEKSGYFADLIQSLEKKI